jgi:hypothetical protein
VPHHLLSLSLQNVSTIVSGTFISSLSPTLQTNKKKIISILILRFLLSFFYREVLEVLCHEEHEYESQPELYQSFHKFKLKETFSFSRKLVDSSFSPTDYPPFRLVGGGMLIWCIAVACSGLAVDFWSLLVARSLTGIGEASFLVMAAPLIDFYAPKKKRTTWLAMFYSAIMMGYAGGAVVGSVITGSQVGCCNLLYEKIWVTNIYQFRFLVDIGAGEVHISSKR